MVTRSERIRERRHQGDIATRGPAAVSQIPSDARTQPAPTQAGGPGPDGVRPNRLRVLLVEDDEQDAFLVGELLAEVHAPVDLIVARTLAQAQARIGGVDCVLLDLGLPDAQQLDGLRRLLAVAQGAAICVLTGLGDEHLGSAAVSEGAQDYLIKGQVDGNVLARSMRYAVERRRADENARRLHEVELLQQESARLERGLLPQPLLRSARAFVHPFYQPGRHSAQLGGDFYDAVETAPDILNVMVGDVCGHGVDEAALGVELRVAWRALMLAGVPADSVLPAIEQVLKSERNRDTVFATVAMVTVDLSRGEAEVRLAGHPPPLLLDGGRTDIVAADHGPVLGVFDQASHPSTRVALGEDWALLLYTDGLIEGRVGGSDRRLDVSGLRSLIGRAETQGVPREALAGWLVRQAEDANGGPLADDVAMLIVRPRALP
jgi:serine phosphatase RsbU (regulator of sigma subunit)